MLGRGKPASINQKQNPDLGSDMSSVCNLHFIPRMSFCEDSSGGVLNLLYVSQASRYMYLVKPTILDFVKH